MPDCIGDGIGVGLAIGDCEGVGDAFSAGVRRLGVVDLFRVVVLGFGFAAGIFFMSCPSCCGNAEALIVNTSVNTKAARHSLRQLINEFMYSPVGSHFGEPEVL